MLLSDVGGCEKKG